MLFYRKLSRVPNPDLGITRRCVVCNSQPREMIRAVLGDNNNAFLCVPCAKKARWQWEGELHSSPLRHKRKFHSCVSNVLRPYSHFYGRRINRTGDRPRYPYAGLSRRPDRLEKLTGGEHWVWAAGWRYRQLREFGLEEE